jgi:hypothetical protein
MILARASKTNANQLIYNTSTACEEDEVDWNAAEEDDVAQGACEDDNDTDDSNCSDELTEDDLLDEDQVSIMGSDSEDESTSSTEDNEECGSQTNDLLSPNGLRWVTSASSVGRVHSANIFDSRAGFKPGLHPETRTEALEVFFGKCIDLTLYYTNLQGRRVANKKGGVWKKASREELLAFFGLHAASGVFKAAHRDLSEMWSLRDGYPIFRATMSEKRFKQLKSLLRFDDPLRRNQDDPLAPVRELVNEVNSSLESNYSPGCFVTVDEQLVEYHGRVRFKQYIPSKPGKFGVKIFWATDAGNTFPLRCLVYIGEKTLTSAERSTSPTLAGAVVMHLLKSYLDCGRNVTMDNWFTDHDLSKTLLDRKTTLVGTVRNNRRFLPAAAKKTAGRQKGDSVHYYAGRATLCSFWDKRQSPVLLLSTQHAGQANSTTTKPAIVEFYNSTKSGVDNLDKLIRTYPSKRRCRRWPYSVAMSFFDASIIAALILKRNTTTAFESHYDYKKELAYELCLPLIRQRARLQTLRSSVRQAMAAVGVDIPANKTTGPSDQRMQGRCHLCPRAKDAKQRHMCSKCGKFACKSHSSSIFICATCEAD